MPTDLTLVLANPVNSSPARWVMANRAFRLATPRLTEHVFERQRFSLLDSS